MITHSAAAGRGRSRIMPCIFSSLGTLFLSALELGPFFGSLNSRTGEASAVDS